MTARVDPDRVQRLRITQPLLVGDNPIKIDAWVRRDEPGWLATFCHDDPASPDKIRGQLGLTDGATPREALELVRAWLATEARGYGYQIGVFTVGKVVMPKPGESRYKNGWPYTPLSITLWPYDKTEA